MSKAERRYRIYLAMDWSIPVDLAIELSNEGIIVDGSLLHADNDN
jgi:hypothetical protein